MFYVNNGGWIANSYPDNTVVEGKDYNGTYNHRNSGKVAESNVGFAWLKEVLSR